MRCAVYTRESKGDPASNERQREDAVRLAEQRGWKVVEILGLEDKSAEGKRARQGFDRLLQLIEDGEVQAVVAWTWERLSRNRPDTVRLVETCQPREVIVALVRGSDINMGTPAGRLTADILASVARNEIDVKADRMDRALLQAAEAGRPPTRRAFGYVEGGMAVDPVEGPAVAEAFARLLAGGSISGITRWLNDNQLWSTGVKPWTTPGVRQMLRRPRYAGIRTYRGEEIGPGLWPALVPEEVFRAAVDLLDDPGRRAYVGSRARKYLGAKLFLCGRCAEDGVETTMRTAYRVYESPGYGKRKVRLYQCRLPSRHISRVAGPVDDYVERVIAGVLRKRGPGLLAKAAPDTTPLRTEAAALRKRIKGLAADLDLDERTMAIRVKALQGRLGEVEDKLAAAGRTSALAQVASAPDPGQAWLELDDLAVRQEVVREVATVTLLPGHSGNRRFDPDTVRVEPR